jgi:hypothetical protein
LGNEWEWGRVLGREHLLGWGVVLQKCTWRWASVQQGCWGKPPELEGELGEGSWFGAQGLEEDTFLCGCSLDGAVSFMGKERVWAYLCAPQGVRSCWVSHADTSCTVEGARFGHWGGAQPCAVALEGGEVFCEGFPGMGRLFHREHVGGGSCKSTVRMGLCPARVHEGASMWRELFGAQILCRCPWGMRFPMKFYWGWAVI